MNASMFAAPQGDGEVFFGPDQDSWRTKAEDWRASFLDRKPFGLSAREVRHEALWPEEPTVLSAHQPVLFHPGLWAKALTASALAGAWGWRAVHKITDQDAPGDAEGWLPPSSEDWTPHALQWTRPGVPYAFQAIPGSSQLTDALTRVLSSPWPSVREAARFFSTPLQEARESSTDWDDWHLACLGILDDVCGTGRTIGRASRFWDTGSFRHFLSRWVKEAGRFGEATNRALRGYRSAQGITHPLTPVPDLGEDEGWRETPFWVVLPDAGRETLSVKAGQGEVLLRPSGNREAWAWPLSSGSEGLAKAPWRRWPKALPQSLYTRLYLTDFFLHGLGGGFYEPVNDLFLEELGEGPASPFGVATATLVADRTRSGELEAESARWDRVAHWRRSFEKNPEYLWFRGKEWSEELPPGPATVCREATATHGFEEAAREKTRLLGELREPARRSEVGRRMKEWNQVWTARLAPLYVALDAFQNAGAGLRKEQEALSFRRYAFFCYPPARWGGLKETVDRRIRKG